MTNTTRAAVIREFDQLVSELGGDPCEVARSARLQLQQVKDPEARLPSEVIARVLGQSATATNCDHFGLELAKRKDLSSHLGLLGELGKSAATLGDALTELFSLMSIHTEATLWQLQRDREVGYVIFSLIDDSAGGYKQVEQLALTVFWRFLDFLTEHHWHPSMVNFTFAKPDDIAPYHRLFNVPIVFDADFCGVVFHSSDLNIKLAEHNKIRHEVLHQFAHSVSSSRPMGLREEARLLVRKNLELRLVGEEYLTRFFPFEKRTLQRRLRAEGTSYRELLHEVRIGMAMDLLSSSDISMTRLADRLCYTDLANFTKAFSEHTGIPPSTWRTRVRGVFDAY